MNPVKAKNGSLNKLQDADRPVHEWYRFVLSFPPHLVREYLQRFEINAAHTVLDPFCGTGTTLIECKKNGIRSVGIEANPLAHFACSVKCDWRVDSRALLLEARRIAEETQQAFARTGLSDFPEFFDERHRQFELMQLPPERQKLLLKDSISPLPLHKALVLLQNIEQSNAKYQRHLKLAFARALVSDASNLHFGPEVGVRAIKRDAPLVNPWLNYMGEMSADLKSPCGAKAVAATPILGDARTLLTQLKPRSIDFVFTSPPYPNEKDYTRTTRLESVLLGFVKNMQELRGFKKNLLRSNTRNVYKEDGDDQFVARNGKVRAIAGQIEARRIALNKTSGFERLYARVTELYFGGMARHLEQLRHALKPGAVLAYVVGDQASYLQVMIRTGQLLAEIAESLGYTVLGIDLFRTRLATATKSQLNEEVVMLKWNG